MRRNLQSIQDAPVSEAELVRAKAQIVRQLAMGGASVPSIAANYLRLVDLDLPLDTARRAPERYRAITAADTHPLVVPRVQGYLGRVFGADDAARQTWAAHWFTQGLQAYEAQVGAGPFCAGDAPGMADACLASHIAGAERFKADLQPFTAVRRIQAACMALPAFADAHPLRQPGAPAA